MLSRQQDRQNPRNLPSNMQINQAVSKTANEFLVVVAGSQDQVAVYSKDPEWIKESHLLRDSFVCAWELVQDGPIEAVIDRIKRQSLWSSLWLKKQKIGFQ